MRAFGKVGENQADSAPDSGRRRQGDAVRQIVLPTWGREDRDGAVSGSLSEWCLSVVTCNVLRLSCTDLGWCHESSGMECF